MHYFESVTKKGNKIWLTKHAKKSVVAKRTIRTKKVHYAIIFSCDSITIQFAVPKGKIVLKKLKNDNQICLSMTVKRV